MIQILYRKDIDSTSWDDFISRTPQRSVYALSWFLDIMPQQWGAVVEWNANHEMETALPFQLVSKFGIQTIHQEEAVKELGLFSLRENPSDSLFSMLCEQYKIISLYRFNTQNNNLSFLHKFNYEITYHLPLSSDYSAILKNYNDDRKRNLKKAKNKDQIIVETTNIDSLITIFKKNVSHKIYGIQEYQYSLLKKMYHDLRERNMSFIMEAKDAEGVTLSAALFIISFDKLIYYFAASTRRGRKYSSQTLLLDHVIQKFCHKNLILDFEGGSVLGIGSFYASFGAHPVRIYKYYQRKINPFLDYILNLRARLIMALKKPTQL